MAISGRKPYGNIGNKVKYQGYIFDSHFELEVYQLLEKYFTDIRVHTRYTLCEIPYKKTFDVDFYIPKVGYFEAKGNWLLIAHHAKNDYLTRFAWWYATQKNKYYPYYLITNTDKPIFPKRKLNRDFFETRLTNLERLIKHDFLRQES